MIKIMSIEDMVASAITVEPVPIKVIDISAEALDDHEFALLNASAVAALATAESMCGIQAMDCINAMTSTEGAKELGDRFITWLKSIVAKIRDAIAKVAKAAAQWITRIFEGAAAKKQKTNDDEISKASEEEIQAAAKESKTDVGEKGFVSIKEFLAITKIATKATVLYTRECVILTKTMLTKKGGANFNDLTAPFMAVTDALDKISTVAKRSTEANHSHSNERKRVNIGDITISFSKTSKDVKEIFGETKAAAKAIDVAIKEVNKSLVAKVKAQGNLSKEEQTFIQKVTSKLQALSSRFGKFTLVELVGIILGITTVRLLIIEIHKRRVVKDKSPDDESDKK